MIRKNILTFGYRSIVLALLLLSFPYQSVAANWQWMAPQRMISLLKEGGGLWVVDVRNEPAFIVGHIEGALLIPSGLIATRHLPKGKIIVLVDDSLGLRRGREAADLLLKNGNDKVFLLEGGMPAWQSEGYPMAGKGNGLNFRSVMPDDVDWALENHIPLRIFDLREKGDQELGPVREAQAVAGKNLAERLEKVKAMLTVAGGKGLAARLEKPATVVLVFPTATDPRPLLERSFRLVVGDLRFMEGGYAAWAAKADKNLTTVGVCPTCPKGTPGGKK
jgi:rhodanese-related sulfurtransferase